MRQRKKSWQAVLVALAMLLQLFVPAAVQAADQEIQEIIVDNTEAESAGTWNYSTGRWGYYGENYSVGGRDDSGSTYLIYRPEIPKTGNYKVSYMQPDGQNDSQSIASNAHFTVEHRDGSSEVRKNQKVSGGVWRSLGEYNFEKGTTGYVKLSTDVDANNTLADAVKFEYTGGIKKPAAEVVVDNREAEIQGEWTSSTYRGGYYGEDYCTITTDQEESTITYRPDLPQTGRYAVYYWGPAGDAAKVPYLVTNSNGTCKTLFDQKNAGSGWNLLGTWSFNQGTEGCVTICNSGTDKNIMADAVRFVLLDQEYDNLEFEKQGNWEETAEDQALKGSYETAEDKDATAMVEAVPGVSGYYTIQYHTPAPEHTAEEIGIQIGGREFICRTGNEGSFETGAVLLEADKTYPLTVTNASGEGILPLDGVRLCYTGYELFYEDFQDASSSEQWSLSGDFKRQEGKLSGTDGMARIAEAVWSNAWVTFEFSVQGDPSQCGIILSGTNQAYTKLSYDSDSRRMVLYDEQTQTKLAASQELEFDANTAHRIEAEYSYPHLQIYLDGVLIMELETARSGDLGFYTEGAAMEIYGLYVSGREGITATKGYYKVNQDQPRQTIWGLGIEVQSDSIGSGNNGLPEEPKSVPHDLVQSERDRLYSDMLQGFRYLRLAGGLYYRGTDEEGKHLQERWDTQNEELAELIDKSGIEGVDFEFWSPTPYFKSSGSYLTTDQKNTLKCFDSSFKGDKQAFLEDFADTIVTDLKYLRENGIPTIQFGLQNEAPHKVNSYSHCHYPDWAYYETMKAVVPKIEEAFPDMHIHADSWNGQYSGGSKKIIEDRELLESIDAWTFHRIGYDSSDQINNASYYNGNKGREDIVVYNNEFEYFDGASDWKCINTAQSIMNWMVFENSPTWHWLHMLKPLGNSEAMGFSLGFWRSPGDEKEYEQNNHIQEGHWDYNYQNFNSVRGFLKHMPWDSVRYDVTEDEVRSDQRIMSYKTPEGKQVVVVTNRSSTNYFNFEIDMGTEGVYRGYRYTPDSKEEIVLTPKAGSTIDPTLPPLSIEFWVQEDTNETMVMADGVKLDENELEIRTGATAQLSAQVTPENAANKSVRFTSSDATTVQVDENGKVTGLKEGTAVITATAVSGSGRYSADCLVTVTEKSDSDMTLEEALEMAREVKEEAERASQEAKKAREEAEIIQKEAQEKLQAAKALDEEARTALEEAKELSQQAGLDSQEAKKALEEAREKADLAVKAQEEAQRSQEAAESAKEEAARMLAQAEEAMEEAQTLAALAEEKAAQAEEDRKKAEEERLAAEKAREEAEAAKKAAEEARKKMEAERAAVQEAAKRAEEAQKAAKQAREELERLKEQLTQEQEKTEPKQEVKKTSLKSVKSRKKREVKVTWKKTQGASGYEILYSTNAGFKNAKMKRAKGNQVSLRLKKLKSKKNCYVKIRAYQKTESGVIYGPYSRVKKAKVK